MRQTFLLGLLAIFWGAFVAYGEEVNEMLKSSEQKKQLQQTYETGTCSGKVVDAVTNEPITGAVVAYAWYIREPGSESGTERIAQYEAITDENGNYFIPNQKVTIAGELSTDLEPERVFVYKKGYLWYMVYENQPRCFMEHEPNLNSEYRKENNIVKLRPWNEGLSHSKHIGIFWNKKMCEYRGPKLEEALNDEWEMAQEEKLAKGHTGSRTMLLRHRIIEASRAFKEGRIDRAECIEQLRTFLTTDNTEVLSLAAVQLYKLRDDSGIEPLIQCLKDNLHRNEFNMALGGLKIIIDREDLQQTEVISERLELVKDIENWWQNNKGRESLWQSSKERRQTESFSKLLLSSVSDKEKGEVLSDLLQSKNKSAAPYLVRFLAIKEQSAELYEATLYLLSKMGDKSAVEAVKPMLYHPDIYVRRQAVLTLNALGDRSGVYVMISSLESKSRNSRAVANAVLREITGQNFAGDKSLRYLSDAEEKAVLDKWRGWWKENKGVSESGKVDFSKVLAGEEAAMQLRYAAMKEKEKNNPELPTFEDTSKSPKATFEQFRAALLKNDVKTALSLMSYPLKEKYEKIFEQFGVHCNDYARGLGKIYFSSKLDDTLYYEMVTEQDEGLLAFPIHFVQDGDGNWLITEF